VTLFSVSKPYRLSPTWTFDCEGILWRLLPDNDGRILGEARDAETWRAWYFCLRENDGHVLWNKLALHQDWWVGIEDVEAGIAYFHGYQKPDMPRHVGIMAHDAESGEFLWRNDEMTYLFASGVHVYATILSFEGPKFSKLSAKDGSIVEDPTLDSTRIKALRASLNAENRFQGYVYPEALTQRDALQHRYATLLNTALDGCEVVGSLDVLEYDDLLLISWHKKAGSVETLQQHFAIARISSGHLLFHDVILDRTASPGVDSFFIKHSLLLYIRNRGILTAHDLSGV